MGLLSTTWIWSVWSISARSPENFLRCGPLGEVITYSITISGLVVASSIMSTSFIRPLRLSCGGVDIFQIWLQLKCLMDLSDLIAPATRAKSIRVIDHGVRHGSVGLRWLFALLRFLLRHVNLIILHHATRVRPTSMFSCLSLLHVDVTTLGLGPGGREIFWVPWVILLYVLAPMWVNNHVWLLLSSRLWLILLILLLLNLLDCLMLSVWKLCRVGARHRFSTV